MKNISFLLIIVSCILSIPIIYASYDDCTIYGMCNANTKYVLNNSNATITTPKIIFKGTNYDSNIVNYEDVENIRSGVQINDGTGADDYFRIYYDDVTAGWTMSSKVGAFTITDRIYVYSSLSMFGDSFLMFWDNVQARFGDSSDAAIYYDGKDFIINPKVVGSGQLKILGITNLTGNNLTNTGDIIPTTTNTKSIGTSALRYLKGWFSGMDINGNLNQTNGNATINMVYGEMWNKSDTGFAKIDLVSVDTYVRLENLTAGTNNGASINNGNMTITNAGVYKITAKVGVLASGAGGDNGMKIFINDTGYNNCYDHEHTSSAQPIGFIIDCILSLQAGDRLTIRFDDHQAPVTDLTALNGNLNVLRIGN